MLPAWLGSLIGGPIVDGLISAYKAKLQAGNDHDRIAADLAARELALERSQRELNARVVLTEQGRWYTAFPRPLFAFAFVIYVWKVVVWDKVLGLGSTDALGGDLGDWGWLVITAYFGGRSVEKVARIFARK
jgi:hypothetical protein